VLQAVRQRLWFQYDEVPAHWTQHIQEGRLDVDSWLHGLLICQI
jgi:hypothetical protein